MSLSAALPSAQVPAGLQDAQLALAPALRPRDLDEGLYFLTFHTDPSSSRCLFRRKGLDAP
jgi:hypothetical protein